MLTQEQISAAVSDALPDVLAGLRKEITEQALYQAKNAASVAVQKSVTDWVNAELVPEIHKALVSSKDGLIDFAPKFAKAVTEELVASMTDELKKRLEQSWNRQSIFKALLSN